jgi:large subunit ribosomal protein L22
MQSMPESESISKPSIGPKEVKVATGVVRNVRVSASKMRRIADQIRGRSYREAELLVSLTNLAGIDVMRDLLKSVGTSATHNFNMNVQTLSICEIRVDEAKVMKRYRFRAQGLLHLRRSRRCHIVLSVEPITK